VLLVAVCLFSVGARVFHLDIPAEQQSGKGLVFDETYYVNAARVIDGVPIQPGERYANAAPPGGDPNAEHPQLGKLVIALGIQLFGDNPIGWRGSAVLFGTAALLLLYWLVRSAGGSRWLALVVTALAAVENLWLVTGRVAALDVYALPFMLAGAALYLRRHPVIAGLVLGVGACVKELALYALIALLLLETLRGIRWLLERRSGWAAGVAWWRQRLARRLVRPLVATIVTVIVFVSTLAVLDAAVPPYADGRRVDQGQSAVCDHALLWSHACNHIAYMNSYAASLRSPNGPSGNSAYPWQFWFDLQPFDYYSQSSAVREGGEVVTTNTVVDFIGIINPVVLVTAWAAILLSLWWAVRRRDDLSFLVVAWVTATWLPAELFSIIDQRTTYLYYMIYTLPAIFIAVARLLAVRRIPHWLLGIWVGILLTSFAILYPFRTITGTG